jgi:hypothetical protein
MSTTRYVRDHELRDLIEALDESIDDLRWMLDAAFEKPDESFETVETIIGIRTAVEKAASYLAELREAAA